MRIAKVTLQRWHHRLRKQSPEVEAAAGLEIERHQLLPNDPGGEQGKATGMGNQEWKKAQIIDRCPHTSKRCLLESWIIQKQPSTLNRELGPLPPVYRQLF